MSSFQSKKNMDRQIRKPMPDVSLSAFAFLLSELVQYSQARVQSISDLEQRLADIGYSVGSRMLELICFRERTLKREIKLIGILSFIHTAVWKTLFGKAADSLERSIEQEDEYMIIENEMLVNKFISVPKDFGNLNCAAFAAGIVHGILDCADYAPERVTAIAVPVEGQQNPKTVILIKFKPSALARE